MKIMKRMKNKGEIDESSLFTFIMPHYGYPLRPAQLEMSAKVDEAFKTNKVFIAEAEVGTGKTFAYLIPAVNQIKRTGKPVLISTGTISLQEQLCQRDIPQISKYLKKEGLIDRDLIVSLEKGKENYICEKRLRDIHKTNALLSSIQYAYKHEWKFDRNEFELPISNDVWNQINVHNCNINKCDCLDCQYRNKRMKSAESDIMVCNHYYMLSCLKDSRRDFLGKFSGVVIDEAHNLESAAFAIFGENRGYDNFESCIRNAVNLMSKSGYIDFIKGYANSAANLAGELFEAIGQESTVPDYAPEFATQCSVKITPTIEKLAYRLISNLKDLSDQISICQSFQDNTKSTDDSIQRQISRLSGFLRAIYSHDDYVWWTQKERGFFRLYNIPKTVAVSLYETLFSQEKPVVLTSATLSANTRVHETESNFDYFNFTTGIDMLNTSKYLCPISKKSGFNYAEHGLIYIEKGIPYTDRCEGANYIEYLRKLAGQIRKAILYSYGKTLVLFTSKDAMEFTYSLVAPTIWKELGIKCYMQGQSPFVRSSFEKDINSCLFATGSFWEGVDIKGPSLSTLVIHKLPFPVPTPINKYKQSEMIASGLGSLVIPEMLTKLKQGSGRLIRDITDRGTLVILDSRAASNRYIGIIRNNLPPFRPIHNLNEIKGFLKNSSEQNKFSKPILLQTNM
jgi:ATP-dependent DNA helicase DinG